MRGTVPAAVPVSSSVSRYRCRSADVERALASTLIFFIAVPTVPIFDSPTAVYCQLRSHNLDQTDLPVCSWRSNSEHREDISNVGRPNYKSRCEKAGNKGRCTRWPPPGGQPVTPSSKAAGEERPAHTKTGTKRALLWLLLP